MNPHHLSAIIEHAETREQAIRDVIDYHLAKDSRLPRVLAERLVDNQAKGQNMNASELATKMLEWEQKKTELDELEANIKVAVLDIGKTQTVGNVRATYSAGRKTFKYQDAANAHPDVDQTLIDAYTTPKIDWRGICKRFEIEPPFTQSSPTVSVKLIG